MTTQAQADEIGHTIGEISRESGRKQLAEAFGRKNWDAWRTAMACDFPPWDKLASLEREAWIAAAAAVRRAEQELVKETTGEVEKRQSPDAEGSGVRPAPAQTGDAGVTPRPPRIMPLHKGT